MSKHINFKAGVMRF